MMRHVILFLLLTVFPLAAQQTGMYQGIYCVWDWDQYVPDNPATLMDDSVSGCRWLTASRIQVVPGAQTGAVFQKDPTTGEPTLTIGVDTASIDQSIAALSDEIVVLTSDLQSANATIALQQNQIQGLLDANAVLSARVQTLEDSGGGGSVPPPPTPIALGESARYKWTGYVVPTAELNHFIADTATGDVAEDQTCGVGPGEVCVRGTWVAGVGGAWPDEALTPMYYQIGHHGNIWFCGTCPEWLGPPSSQANGWMPRISLDPVRVGGGEWLVVLAEQQWQVGQ